MIHIITDSTSDLDKFAAQELGIDVIPLTVHFGDEAYLDGITLTKNSFYSLLANAEKLPTTSQLNPSDILSVVSPYLEKGEDVVGIFLSSALSGTFQSASIASQMAESEHFYLVDSANVTFGLALLVRVACRLRDEGKTAPEIVSAIEGLKSRVRVIAVVDTLKYLQMGGRISASTAMLGNLLGINPLVAVIDGKVESIGKARGKKSAYRHLGMMVSQDAPDLSYPVYFGHSHSPETMEDLKAVIVPQLEGEATILSVEIGTVIGTHVGPGAAGMAYIAAK